MLNPAHLCQIEIQVADLQQALAFLTQVFGWRPVPAEIQNYVVMDVPEDCPYGISLVPALSHTAPNASTTLYFGTDDPELYVEKAKQAGGALRLGPKKLPGYGSIYQIQGPGGLRIGLFKKSSVL